MSFPVPVAVGLVALVVTHALAPVVRRIARRLGAIDYPGGRRVNTRPTPRLGGAAIYLGFVAAALVAMVVARPIELVRSGAEAYIRIPIVVQTDRAILGIMLGGTFLFLCGIYDDIRGLHPGAKFLAMLAAAAVLIPFGLATQFLTHPLTGKTVALGPWGALFTILWVVAVVNVINFIDGLDGLAAGIVAIAGTTLLLVAWAKRDVVAVSLAAALVGAALGFLRHNFNPARIFMGDSGSMFLGYVLGGLSVMGLYKSYTAISLLVPILALGVPIADAAFAIVRRWRSGRPIYLPDRGHLHHRLLDRGLTQRQTVLLLYLVSALLGLGALALAGVNRPAAIVTLGVIAAILVIGAQRMGLLAR
ncbi:MAG: MraY family glycosyltransferase [Armatimonadota bacterium]|nr:MraY family glycosyltransferase [Armatimonadota bacterium]MDR7519305.1 MraY family glycosyltransferase [Armatimonadota bacterium]MDR7550162.1 MraY family glycosyltransferase [Armatimonadota bacterium]